MFGLGREKGLVGLDIDMFYKDIEEFVDINYFLKKKKEMEEEKGPHKFSFMRCIKNCHKELDINIVDAERIFKIALQEESFFWDLFRKDIGFSHYYKRGSYGDKTLKVKKLLKEYNLQ